MATIRLSTSCKAEQHITARREVLEALDRDIARQFNRLTGNLGAVLDEFETRCPAAKQWRRK